MMKVPSALATVALLLPILAGCTGDAEQARTEEPVGARVGEMLYRDGLMAVPEVNARMREAVLAIDHDGLPADSVLDAFHDWLVAWAATHPDRIADARNSVPPGEPGFPETGRWGTADPKGPNWPGEQK